LKRQLGVLPNLYQAVLHMFMGDMRYHLRQLV
jgi:hypothetical protein